MKKQLLLALGFIAPLSLVHTVNAALIAYEGFTNASGAAIVGSAGGTGWAEAWQLNGAGGVGTNTADGLNYVDGLGNVLVTSGGAGFFQGLTTGNASETPNRAWSGGPLGTNGVDDGAFTWISFLAVRQGPTNAGANPYARGAQATFDYVNNSGGNQKIAAGNSSGNGQNTVGILSGGGNIRSGTSTYGAVPPATPLTNFIVVAIEHTAAAGSNDNAYLFVNPNLNAQPALSTAQTNVLGLYDYTIDRIRVFAGGNSSAAQPYAELVLDEVRIGQTWDDVTPHTSVVSPVTTFNWVGVTNVLNSMYLQMTGGLGSNYVVEATANLAITNGWTTIGNLQLNGGGTGTFVDTNIVATNALRFYRARTP